MACATVVLPAQDSVEEQPSSRRRSPFSLLYDTLRQTCKELAIPWTTEMSRDLPAKWEKHGDMVLLPENSFTLSHWRMLGKDLWPLVAECLNVQRIGRKKRIADDDYRTPHIDLIYGEHGWVEHVDNQIRYQYDVRKCMFSIGNITEKLRIAEFNCRGETVVDLFAGIGYFTLPYLVHAKCDFLYACEWNQDAVEALRRNLHLNRVAGRCTVLEGDCRKNAPTAVADRVNLGLLPTAHAYWLTACRALKKSGGLLHIHENITSATKVPSRRGSTPPKAPLKRRNSSPTISLSGLGSDRKEKIDLLRRTRTNYGIEVPETVYEISLRKESDTAPTSLEGTPEVDEVDSCSLLSSKSSSPEPEPTDEHTLCNGNDVGKDGGGRPSPRRKPVLQMSIESSGYCSAEETKPGVGNTENVDTANDQQLNDDSAQLTDAPPKRKISMIILSNLNQEFSMPFTVKVAPEFCNAWENLDPTWREWALSSSQELLRFLRNIHDEPWSARILGMRRVKRYAPHIDHVVFDIECRPTTLM